MTAGGVGAASAGALPRRSWTRAWIKLYRVHFIPLSVSAGLVGVVTGRDHPSAVGIALAMIVCATGYGVGVVVNDYADRRADAVNAPDRPFVTGEINPNVGLAIVLVLASAMAIGAAFLAPGVAVWGVAALAGHVVYQATKGTPMVGNVVNGIDLALFTLVGAAGARSGPVFDMPTAVWVDAGLIAVVLSGFCLVGYFKDVAGDAVAGYRTLPVALGAARARWFTLPWPLAAIGGSCALAVADPALLGAGDGVSPAFWAFVAAAAGVFAVSLSRLIRDPEAGSYEALVWFVRATVLFAFALGAAVDPKLFLSAAAPMAIFLEVSLLGTRGTGQA